MSETLSDDEWETETEWETDEDAVADDEEMEGKHEALGLAKNNASLPPLPLPPPLLLPPLPDSPHHLPPLPLSPLHLPPLPLSSDLRISRPCTSTDVDVPITVSYEDELEDNNDNNNNIHEEKEKQKQKEQETEKKKMCSLTGDELDFFEVTNHLAYEELLIVDDPTDGVDFADASCQSSDRTDNSGNNNNNIIWESSKKKGEDKEHDKGDFVESVEHAENENNSNKPSLEETEAATIIEARFRGYLTRKRLEQDRKTKAKTMKKQAAAVSIQKNFRGYLARKQIDEENVSKSNSGGTKGACDRRTSEASAATLIQSRFRSYQATKQLEGQKKAAVLIQKNFRGFQTRKKLEEEGADCSIREAGPRCCCSPETPESSPEPERPDPCLKEPITLIVAFPGELKLEIVTRKGSTIKDIKELVGRYLVFRDDLLALSLNSWLLDDDDRSLLTWLEFPHTTSTLQLRINSKDPVHLPLPQLENPTRIFHVRVDVLGMPTRVLLVEIVRDFRRKFFLGGFRHKRSGAEFHHATTQTRAASRRRRPELLNHRETQTAEMKSASVATAEETSTQMTRPGAYVTNGRDRIMFAAERYVTADEYHAVLVAKAIVLQKYWRRWLARRRVARLLAQLRKKRRQAAEEKEQRRKAKEERLRSEFDRRINPRTKADFDILYAALERWRQGEMKQINATLAGAERKAELCRLLDQETEYINAIGKHENQAKLTARRDVEKLLPPASGTLRQRGADGRTTSVDTPSILLARKLKRLYESVCLRGLSLDERLDVLRSIKETVSPHKNRLTQELIMLMDREAEFIMRGIMKNNLDPLRNRIQTAFLQFIRNPKYNPDASSAAKLCGGSHKCGTCSSYRPIQDFPISSNSKSPGKCRHCIKLENDAHSRIDYGFYGVLLRQLRKQEEEFDDDSRICHLMKETDIKYLVDEVWKTRSALSCHDDVYDLILLRWNKDEEWSPWNTVLLTKEEAGAHRQISNPKLFYDSLFLCKIASKHNTARNHFIRLPWLVKYVKSKTTKKAREMILVQEGGTKREGNSCRLQRDKKTNRRRVLHETHCEHTNRSEIGGRFVISAIANADPRMSSVEGEGESGGEEAKDGPSMTSNQL